MTYEKFCELRDVVEPELLKGGWIKDLEGPLAPNPFHPPRPLRKCYRDPKTGLYYGLKDAMRVAIGVRPFREGIAKPELIEL